MFAALDRKLAWSEPTTTALLWVLAIVAGIVAIAGTPTLKAAVAGWMVLP